MTAPAAGPRVAYLVSHYPRANHTYILREVLGLRALGFDVDVLSVSGDDRPMSSLTDVERAERERVFVVKEQGVARIVGAQLATLATRPVSYLRGLLHAVQLAGFDLRALAYNLVYFAEAVVVGRHLASIGVTRLHSHFSTTVAMLAGTTFPLRVSMTVHGHAEFTNPDALFIRQKIAAADFIVAISQFGKSQLMSLSTPEHWDKLEVVPLGVDPSSLTPVSRTRAPDGPFRLLFVGELRPVKGMHVLVDAIERLVARGRDVTLRIVGDGPQRASLIEAVRQHGLADRITFLGRLNQDEVRAEYAMADAFTLPSFAEGIPVVLMEAMAMEIPCISTRITGVPELIRDGEDGLLVTPADVGELAEAIDRLAGDPALCARLGRSGRARVVERFNAPVNVARLAEVLHRRAASASR